MTKRYKTEIKLFKDTLRADDESDLGLDADGSSININNILNSDNDRITGNPDGEDDNHNTNETPGHSLLEDK